MQRDFQSQITTERQLGWPYPYGLVEARLSRDELENMRVRFDRLRAVMPSGVVVSVPDGAELPARDIKETFQATTGAFTVSLGVPLWYSSRANVVDAATAQDWHVKRLYRTKEIQWTDENTGENPQAVLVRRINARLVLEGDDPSDLEILPLLRIAHAAGEDVGLPRVDPDFIPPCLVVAAYPGLRDLVRDLAHQVEASRKELTNQMTRGGGFSVEAMRGVQFEQALRLRTLGAYGPRLLHLVEAPAVSPFAMYLELRSLLGELAALHPERDAFDAVAYNHDSPGVCFNDLSDRIRPLLRGAVAPSFLKLPFEKQEGIFVVTLTDEHLSRPNEYFLGIKTKDDPRAVSQLVEDADQFKLLAKSLARRRMWGVKLQEERHPPLELPSEAGLHYFLLVRAESAVRWERIVAEKEIAVVWPGIESSDFQLTLYMTVPDIGGKP
jgi:type VI secretion system protein ImpJ